MTKYAVLRRIVPEVPQDQEEEVAADEMVDFLTMVKDLNIQTAQGKTDHLGAVQ